MQLTAVQHHISNCCTYHQPKVLQRVSSHTHAALSALFREICELCLEMLSGDMDMSFCCKASPQNPALPPFSDFQILHPGRVVHSETMSCSPRLEPAAAVALLWPPTSRPCVTSDRRLRRNTPHTHTHTMDVLPFFRGGFPGEKNELSW